MSSVGNLFVLLSAPELDLKSENNFIGWCSFSESEYLELIKLGGCELLLNKLISALSNDKHVHVSRYRPCMETLSHMAMILGYGRLSPADPSHSVESLRRFTLMCSDNLSCCPLQQAFGHTAGNPMVLLSAVGDLTLNADIFDLRVHKLLDVLPIVFALFMFSPAAFYAEAAHVGFLHGVSVWLEHVVATNFLLLPKANRQQVTQEWAYIQRNMNQETKVRPINHLAHGWDILNLRVKSLNKHGLKIDLVLRALDEVGFFIFVLTSYPPCKHEIDVSFHKQRDFNAVMLHVTAKLQVCMELMYHVCRMMISSSQLSAYRSCVIVLTLMTLEGTLETSHIALDKWNRFYQRNWWLDIIVRTRQHLHRDDSGASWLSSQLGSTLDVAEAVLQEQLGLAQQIRRAQLDSGKMSLVINDVVCCAPRRCKALQQHTEVLLSHCKDRFLDRSSATHSDLNAAAQPFLPANSLFNITDNPQPSPASRIASQDDPPLQNMARDRRLLPQPIGPPIKATSKSLKLQLPGSILSILSPLSAAFADTEAAPELDVDNLLLSGTLTHVGIVPPISSFSSSLSSAPAHTFEFHTPKIATSLSSTSLSSALSDIASGGVETLGSVKTCPTCGRIEDSPRQFLVCSGCALVAYCSAHCQHLDWSKHKHVCLLR